MSDVPEPTAEELAIRQDYSRTVEAELRMDLERQLAARDARIAALSQYVRHKRGCRVNPGGRIMAALGDPEVRSCDCGLDSLLAECKINKPEQAL